MDGRVRTIAPNATRALLTLALHIMAEASSLLTFSYMAMRIAQLCRQQCLHRRADVGIGTAGCQHNASSAASASCCGELCVRGGEGARGVPASGTRLPRLASERLRGDVQVVERAKSSNENVVHAVFLGVIILAASDQRPPNHDVMIEKEVSRSTNDAAAPLC